MDFRILGPLEVQDDGDLVALGGTKQRALLAILLLNANEVVSSDRLIDELWGQEPPDTAAKGLQGYVSGLRKVLESRRAGHPPARLRDPASRPASSTWRASSGCGIAHGRPLADGDARRPRRRCARRSRSGVGLRWRTSPTSPSPRRRSAVSRSCASARSRSGSRPILRSAVTPMLVAELEPLVPRASAARAPARAADARPLPLGPTGRGARGLPGDPRDAGRRARHRAGRASCSGWSRPSSSTTRRSTSFARSSGLRDDARAATLGAPPFVGRERELAELLLNLDDVLSGSGRLVLVPGEPGSGRAGSRLSSRRAQNPVVRVSLWAGAGRLAAHPRTGRGSSRCAPTSQSGSGGSSQRARKRRLRDRSDPSRGR